MNLKSILSFLALISFTQIILAAERGDIAQEMREFKRSFDVIDGRRFLIDGINCHGTTLHAAGLLSYPSHVDERELNHILDNYCTKIARPENDSIATLSRYNNWNSHSYFHLTDSRIIEKRALVKEQPIKYKSRGYSKSAEYFSCPKISLSCPSLDKLKNRIHIIGLYFANLSIGNAWPSHAQEYLNFARRQKSNLDKFDTRNGSCLKLKRLLSYRLQSLISIAENTADGGYLFQQLPRGSKL